jgi:multiple sugar transport system substrate-binding protein
VQQVGIGQLTAEEALKDGQRKVLSICNDCLLPE